MSGDVVPFTIGRAYPSHPAMLGLLLVLELGVGLVLARHGVRFDGYMDVHRTPMGDAVPLGLAITDQIAAIVIPLGIVLALIRVWSNVPDNLASAAVAVVARLPVLVVGAIVLWMPLPATIDSFRPESVGSLQASLVLPALVSVVCVVTGYSLLVVGLRQSTGARGFALALQSLAAFVLAEVGGKVLLFALR